MGERKEMNKFNYKLLMAFAIMVLTFGAVSLSAKAEDEYTYITYKNTTQINNEIRNAIQSHDYPIITMKLNTNDADEAEAQANTLNDEILANYYAYDMSFPYGGYYFAMTLSGSMKTVISTPTINENGTYDISIYLKPSYILTYAQDQQLDSAVTNVLSSIGANTGTDYEKTKKIYDYICSTVTYLDYNDITSENLLIKNTAYGALINHTAQCQGYAQLFYLMTAKAGVESRIIIGSANGDGHAWNIVKIDGTFYQVDSTWDAGAETYRYFLKSSSMNYHTISWTKTQSFMNTSETVTISSTDYSASTDDTDTDSTSTDNSSQDTSTNTSSDTEEANNTDSTSNSTNTTSENTAENTNNDSSTVDSTSSVNDNESSYTVGSYIKVGKYAYKITSSNSVKLTTIPKTTKTLNVPDTITYNGKKFKVTSIQCNVSDQSKKLKKIVIGKNIKTIESYTFNNCTNIKKIIFKSKSLKKIGKNAFKNVNKAKISFKSVSKSKQKKIKKLLKKSGYSI